MFYELRWEVIVRFVDIGGIVEHHCLNFLFLKSEIYLIYISKFLDVDSMVQPRPEKYRKKGW